MQHMYPVGFYSGLKKKGILTFPTSRDEPLRYYAEKSRTVTKRQMLPTFAYMSYQERSESRVVFAGGYREGKRFNGVKFQGPGFVCVCTFLCTCWGRSACTHVQEWLWKPEVDTGCLPQSLTILFFEARSVTEPVAHQTSQPERLAGQEDLVIFLSLLSQYWKTNRWAGFYMGAGMELRSSSLHGKHFTESSPKAVYIVKTKVFWGLVAQTREYT